MKKHFSFLLALMASTTFSHAAIVNGTCGDNLTWSLNTKDSTLTIQGSGRMDDYTNWNDDNRSPWNEYRTYIAHVVFPEGLTYVGEAAFYEHTNIQAILLPDSVTNIASYAFAFCRSAKTIQLSAQLDSIGNGAFNYCDQISSITIPQTVTYMGPTAFAFCKTITSIEFPDSLKVISNDAFTNCSNLKMVTLGSGIERLGEHAFSYTSIARLTSKAATPPTGGANCGITAANCKLYVPEESIETYTNAIWWEDFKEILAIGTPDPLMNIQVQVVFPQGEPEAGIEVFGTFNNGEAVAMNYNQQYNIWWADINASEMQTFNFREIGNPNNVILYSTDNGVTWQALEDMLITDFVSEQNSQYYIALDFVNATGLLAKWAINNSCGDQLRWNVADSVLTITGTGDMWDYGNGTAPWKDNFHTVVLPEGLTHVGIGAFTACSKLTSVVWNAVDCPTKEEGDNVYPPFHTIRSQITSLTIGESVSVLPVYMCYEMTNLKKIEIPASVTKIDIAAFGACTGLTSVTCHAVTPPTMGTAVFYNVQCANIPLYVPFGSIAAYKADAQWKVFKNISGIPGTEDIEDIIVDSDSSTRKILRDGQILILRGDKVYTLQGAEVR